MYVCNIIASLYWQSGLWANWLQVCKHCYYMFNNRSDATWDICLLQCRERQLKANYVTLIDGLVSQESHKLLQSQCRFNYKADVLI